MSYTTIMRFLHTADWHLGRIFHGERLTEDQHYVLRQLIDITRDSKVDAVLISGDIFDRAVPPPEAVAVLDDVLSQLVLSLKVPVLIIAGNHDSADRLAFGARLLSQQNLFVVGSLSGAMQCITLPDRFGPVHFYAVPYAEPQQAREFLDSEDVEDHHTAMRGMLDRLRPANSARSVLLAHAYVAGGEASESERPISVGTAGLVAANCFDGFSYVALGHLHQPQQVGDPRIRYAGSLLKYSFTEAHHRKTVQIIEMDERGHCTAESVPLHPRRDVRRIEGHFAQLVQAGPIGDPQDYVSVVLLDQGPILDAMNRLRAVYPYAMKIERPYLEVDGAPAAARPDFRKISDRDLFAAFFQEVTGEELSDDAEAALTRVLRHVARQEREATA